jgi:hypothetical protein
VVFAISTVLLMAKTAKRLGAERRRAPRRGGRTQRPEYNKIYEIRKLGLKLGDFLDADVQLFFFAKRLVFV